MQKRDRELIRKVRAQRSSYGRIRRASGRGHMPREIIVPEDLQSPSEIDQELESISSCP